MAARKATAKRTDARIFIEILQNGEPVASLVHPLRKRRTISFGAQNGDLRIPHYPLSDPHDIFEIDRTGVYFMPHTSSEGFLRSKGNVRTIVAHSKENLRKFPVAEGDYGSVSFRDLKVLFRVGRDNKRRPAQTVVAAGKYRGAFWALWAMPSWEAWALGAATLAVVTLFAGLVQGLLSRHVTSQVSWSDLGPAYKLPFVAAAHLEDLPEALQNKLVRPDMLNQAIGYYRELSRTLAGEPNASPRLVEPTTAALYGRFADEQAETIATQEEAQRRRETALLGEPGTAIMAIPAVRGETLAGRILRVQDKLSLQHESFAAALAARREATATFKDDYQLAYDFADYKNPKKALEKKKEVQHSLEQIKPFAVMTDEEAMYWEAKQLAGQAAASQKRLALGSQRRETLTPRTAAPLTLAPEVDFASFLPRQDYTDFNRKLAFLQASEYGVAKKPREIREPLIGRLDPALIEKVIAARRFELQLCYELALRRDQSLAGTMEWQWRLDTRGQLSELKLLSSSINDSLMVNCVRGKISQWRFPRPDRGSVEVQYPFSFKKTRG